MNKAMNRILLNFVMISSVTYMQASPIVDIENVRKSGQVGNFWNMAFAFSGSRGNEVRDDLQISLSLANNDAKTEKLFVFERSERTKDEITEDESTFLHARVLRKINEKPFDFEIYIQSSENPFQSYKSRSLLGAGIRLNELNDILLSISLLQEDEESLEGVRKKTPRANLYLFKDFSFDNDSFIAISSFIQPSIEDFSNDYKYSLSLSYSIPVSEKFLVNFKISETFDNDPPDLAQKSDQSFVTGFNYSF